MAKASFDQYNYRRHTLQHCRYTHNSSNNSSSNSYTDSSNNNNNNNRGLHTVGIAVVDEDRYRRMEACLCLDCDRTELVPLVDGTHFH
jgi:hypothetical protein